MKQSLTRIAGCTVLIGFLAGQASAGDPEGSRGAELLIPFKQELKQALLDGLAEDPDSAVAACKVEAPRIAAELSKDGVALGRTSHKLRNPDNAGPDWVAPILDAYVETTADLAPRSVRLPEGRSGYVEPILVQPLCLTCHGDVQDPALLERIETDYPHDRAIGFAPGELRGVFWVEYPSAAHSK